MKPADFLLGILDFFAVLLPGAVAVWVALQYVHRDPRLVTIAGKPLTEGALWAAYLFASYILGHIVFMIGSNLDTAYDAWRRREKPTDRDRTFRAEDALRKRINPALDGAEFSTLKWAKSYIQIHSPAARVEIDRFEATSKFFRSFVVIAVALTAHFLLAEHRPALALAALLLAILSYRRFFDQRWKATELSYATVCILEATRTGPPPAAAGKKTTDDDS